MLASANPCNLRARPHTVMPTAQHASSSSMRSMLRVRISKARCHAEQHHRNHAWPHDHKHVTIDVLSKPLGQTRTGRRPTRASRSAMEASQRARSPARPVTSFSARSSFTSRSASSASSAALRACSQHSRVCHRHANELIVQQPSVSWCQQKAPSLSDAYFAGQCINTVMRTACNRSYRLQ